MEYKLLNLRNRKKMNGICKSEIEMEWEDSELIEILLGKLPKVRRTRDDEKVTKQINALENMLRNYDVFSTNKEQFIKEISQIVLEIRDVCPYWYGIDTFEIQRRMDMQKFCLISGEGGIGKSYFVKCLEEELERKNIEHLCIYGKFEKNIDVIDEAEIIGVAKENTFVLVIDAVNEMPVQSQRDWMSALERLKVIDGMRIVLTYRTGTILPDVAANLEAIAQYSYRFPGVSYESALVQLSKIPIADVYKYEDILYSNNPMLLNMLCTVLQNKKVEEQTVNGVSTITYILEQYIKIGLKDVNLWKSTKKITAWMYDNNKKWIDKNSLIQIVDNPNDFIEKMTQQGFLTEYISDGQEKYSFAIDTLTDFLLARKIWSEFDKDKLDESVRMLLDKLYHIYGIEEVVILALFDKYAPDYAFIKEILVKTKLIERFEYETILKIRFKEEEISPFLEYFVPSNKKELLLHFGGYIDKPFNCVNYLNDYYWGDSKRQLRELSGSLSGRFVGGRVKERLKNILYFINVRDGKEKRLEEAFFFALWCCAAPNKDIRYLAMKLLYDVVVQESKFKDVLEQQYKQIRDEYIREAVIYVICKSANLTEGNRQFIEGIIADPMYVHAKSLKRIATVLGKDYDYINWEKENKFVYSSDSEISENLNRLFFHVDLQEKYLLHFRYWGKNHIDIHNQFLNVDKKEIGEWNKILVEAFPCVKSGECCGSLGFEKNAESYYGKDYRENLLDINSFMCSFERVIKEYFDVYGVLYDAEERAHGGEREFENSLMKKAIIIAQDIFYGSMMCNYFTNQFATYNNVQNSIGYEVYDPIEYEEEMRITPPISVFQEEIEKMGDIIISRMTLPDEDTVQWVKNVTITENNLYQLTQPVELDGEEWILIATRLFIHEGESGNHNWQDHYNYWCCTSKVPMIKGDTEDRYLTIELKEYRGNLEEYGKCLENPYLCKDVPVISSDSEIFDNTHLVLPPAELIHNLNLNVSLPDMTWRNSDNEIIIRCNNNKHSYYEDFIGGTVFMRKDVYDEYVNTHFIKFFAYTEKWTPSTGFADETALHFEIIDGKIVNKYYNHLANRVEREENSFEHCTDCPFGFLKKDYSENPFLKFLKDYGIDNDLDELWDEIDDL